MLISDTYPDKKVLKEINEQVGGKFNLVERWKMNGVGSQRFDIVESSPAISDLLRRDMKPDTCNIELRKRGIIVRFQSKADTYAWTIPYHFLQIYRTTNRVNIYSKTEFMKCAPSFNSRIDSLFIAKILELKGGSFTDISEL